MMPVMALRLCVSIRDRERHPIPRDEKFASCSALSCIAVQWSRCPPEGLQPPVGYSSSTPYPFPLPWYNRHRQATAVCRMVSGMRVSGEPVFAPP